MNRTVEERIEILENALGALYAFDGPAASEVSAAERMLRVLGEEMLEQLRERRADELAAAR